MCYHGLGHGVFAYFGYDLSKTVSFCKQMGTAEYEEEQYTQCVGGAIMELMGGGGHDRSAWLVAREKYLADDPLSPCLDSVIPDRARSYCLMYLTPELLVRAGADLANPSPDFFPKAFRFCDAISQDLIRYRHSCFGGFGKEFVPLAGARDIRTVDSYTDEEYTTAGRWCALSPVQDGAQYCIREALQSVFWGGENDPGASFRFCSSAPESLRDSCYDELAQVIKQYLPERSDLCAMLPKENEQTCVS